MHVACVMLIMLSRKAESINNTARYLQTKKITMSEEKQQVVLAISGSRNYDDYDAFCKHMSKYIDQYHNNSMPNEIISGGAKGVDTLARQFANENNIKIQELNPEYHKFPNNPKYAPLARDKEIVKLCTHLVAFPTKESVGTRHTIKYAQDINRPTVVYEV